MANIKGVKNHDILKQSLEALACNDHRGGCNWDNETGDGAGIMAQIPWRILEKWAESQNLG